MRCSVQAAGFVGFVRKMFAQKRFLDSPVVVEINGGQAWAMFSVSREVAQRTYDPFQFIVKFPGKSEEAVSFGISLNQLQALVGAMSPEDLEEGRELVLYIEKDQEALLIDIGKEDPDKASFEPLVQVRGSGEFPEIPKQALPYEHTVLGLRFDELGAVSFYSPKANIEARWNLFRINSAQEAESVLAGLVKGYEPKMQEGDTLMSSSKSAPKPPPAAPPPEATKSKRAASAPPPPPPPAVPPVAVEPPPPPPPPSNPPEAAEADGQSSAPLAEGGQGSTLPAEGGQGEPPSGEGQGGDSPGRGKRRTAAQIEADRLVDSLGYLRARGYTVTAPNETASEQAITPESLATDIAALSEQIRQKTAQLGALTKGLMTYDQAMALMMAKLKA